MNNIIESAFKLDVTSIDKIQRNKPVEDKVVSKGKKRSKYLSASRRFQDSVFYYLHAHKDEYKIRSVKKFTNKHVDGAVALENGQYYLVEVKYRLNWLSACNGIIEILRCRAEIAGFKKPTGAIIIFEKFSRDWDKKQSGRKQKNGWYRFYEDQRVMEAPPIGFPIRIIQLRKDGLRIVDYSKLKVTRQDHRLSEATKGKRLRKGMH